MSESKDTIAAIATPPGSGGVGVIRLSGLQVSKIAVSILGDLPLHRTATYRSFRSADDQILDQGLALFFPGPDSFTGEDVLELHGHGGSVVMNRLLKRVLELGARQAKPGEFSERAFLNGKMDLVQAEAVSDLINSASEQAAISAIRSLSGEFSNLVIQLKEQIISMRMLIEAHMDFTDEELDIPVETFKKSVHEAIDQNQNILDKARQGAVLNEGIRIAIIGEPNVGKSSLLNSLLQQDRAIVTDIPGTTRDTLTEKFLIDGVPFLITDTAGLRTTDDPVELEGINRTNLSMQTADVVLIMSEYPKIAERISTEVKNKIYVANKIDQLENVKAKINQQFSFPKIQLSAKTGEGLDFLKKQLLKFAGVDAGAEGIFTARQRHIEALENTRGFLNLAEPCLTSSETFDLAAENLRLALHSLGEITGEFTTEDLLGEIFSGFCIGK
ncbi:MAG: tRNA uridine-5-carboxymethylaminomethyl(34) synthesis GTPase MnmE [Gammaproteobacteria bacterium]